MKNQRATPLRARRADGLARGKDAGTADTLARAYFVSGDPAKALESEQRALGLVQGAGAANEANRSYFEAQVKQYQQAARAQ